MIKVCLGSGHFPKIQNILGFVESNLVPGLVIDGHIISDIFDEGRGSAGDCDDDAAAHATHSPGLAGESLCLCPGSRHSPVLDRAQGGMEEMVEVDWDIMNALTL